MRRSLVLGDETARHPFLQTLPPHVRSGRQLVLRPMLTAALPPEVVPSMLEEAQSARRRWSHATGHAFRTMWRGSSGLRSTISAADLRMFLMAYCACFLAVSAFIW